MNNSVPQVAAKAIRNNIIIGLISTGICFFFGGKFALGFAVGFLVAIANFFLLYSSVLKGLMLDPEKAKRHMIVSYPPRFIITALFMGYMVWSTAVSPLTLLAGFTVTLMTTVISIIFAIRGDVDPFSIPLRDF